jgi:hypothetical protein
MKKKTSLACLMIVGLIVIFLILLMTQPVLDSVATDLSTKADAAELRRHVVQLSEILPPRNSNPRNLNVSADYVFRHFALYGQPEYQEFIARKKTYRNVSLRLGHGDGPLLIVGAHYDTKGGRPGADDNASGVAGLLELARLLSATKLDTPVELVAYTLEESSINGISHFGSYQHAKRLRTIGRDVSCMISLEMIGYFTDDKGSQHFPIPGMATLYPDTGNFISVVGRLEEIEVVREFKGLFRSASDLPVYSLNSPPLIPGMKLSDHSSYWDFGYKAIMVTDTAYLRNPNYHKDTDTAKTLDYEKMAKVVSGVYAFIIGIAEQ